MSINTFVSSIETLAAVRVIVTHNGPAHDDETVGTMVLLAKIKAARVALGLTLPPVRVERRDPVAADFADSSVIVLDVGKQPLDLVQGNLDHHQDPNEVCAAILAARYVGLEAEMLGAFPALSITDKLDRKGPFAVAKELGVEPKLIFGLQSLLGAALKGRFEKFNGAVADHFVELLCELGEELVDQAERFGRDLAALLALPTFEVKGGLKAVRLPDELRGTPALQAFLDQSGVNLFLSKERSNKGYQMTRVNDHPAIDFRRLKDGPIGMLFIHPAGFTAAVLKESDVDAALEVAIA